MFTALRKRFRRKSTEHQGKTPHDTLTHYLGELHVLTSQPFAPSKARALDIETKTDSLLQLGDLLIETSLFCHSRSYIPDHMSKRLWTSTTHPFTDYITDGNELIHPLDWVEQHRHYITKLTAALSSMDDADREYYQRKCGFVVDDIVAVIRTAKSCL